MLRLSDQTLIEADGNYSTVLSLMGSRTWMLRSTVTVIGNDNFAANYILHFWNNGTVVIFETSRPIFEIATDSDLQEIKEWCMINGWQKLTVDNRLLVDPRGFNFWMQKYRMGLVDSDQLRKSDDDEAARMSKYLENEKDEDEDEEDSLIDENKGDKQNAS